MKRNHSFRILRDIFHILSYATNEDLVLASRQEHISPNVAGALEALAQESAQPIGRKKSGKRTDREPRRRTGDSEFSKMLSTSPLLQDKNAILSLARQLGLKLTANSKDSHSRVLSRFTTLMKTMPDQLRMEVLKRLENERSSETEGWINIINQRKP
jgi:hypothetical protein